MSEEQLKTAMAAAWLQLEVEAANHNRQLSEQDRQMWALGFIDGATAMNEFTIDRLKPELRREHGQ